MILTAGAAAILARRDEREATVQAVAVVDAAPAIDRKCGATQLGLAAAPMRLRQSTVNLISGGLICGFIGGGFYYTTHAVKQDGISSEEIEQFRRQRDAKKQS